jgi:proline utilization trans-activator
MQPPPAKKTKRRVSDAQRQRVSVSCDRCKTRKIRCIRIAGNGDACAACAQLSLACESTLPRKQRVYATYDQLQTRYPDDHVETTEDIRNLAKRCGVDMSTFDLDETGEMEQVMRNQEGESSTSTSTVHSQSAEDANLFASIHRLCIPEGALIPAPRGGYHYVGPASSYLFANTIRHLVKKLGTSTPPFDRPGYRRQQRAHEFTSAERTTALEARIPGHPVMAAELEETSPSVRETFNAACRSDTDTIPSPQDRTTPRSILGSASGELRDLLPPRRLADRLVDAFFDRVHLNFHLFDRSTFRVQYESLWSTGRISGPGSTVPESGWTCVLYMVFVLGAQSLERDNLQEASAIQRQYLTIVVREGLQRVVLTATLANVHALALLGLYQHNAGERNTAWMLVGHASRMAIALGIQRDGENANFDYITRNTRRTTWWTLNLFEQNLSFILGRPSATSTIDVSALFPDDDFSNGGDTPHGFLQQAVKLGDISAQIKRFIASISTHFAAPYRLIETTDMANQLDQVLSRWELSLPQHLQSSAPFATPRHRRSVQLLHATCSHLRSVLGRPYLLCRINHQLDHRSAPFDFGDPSQTLAPAIEKLAQISLMGARRCMSVLADLADHGCLEGELWYDYYYIHHASLILSLPFLIDPHDSQHASDRAMISTALNLAKHSRLAPTYRILVNVSIQFADIVGIGPDDDPSRPPSPRRPVGQTLTELNQAARANNGRVNDNFSDWDSELQHTILENNLNAVGMGTGTISNPLLPGLSSDHHATTISNNNSQFVSNPTANSWSLLPILNDVSESQPFSLEQLLSTHIPSLLPDNSYNAEQQLDEVLFTDMFNFGYEVPTGSAESRRQSGLGPPGIGQSGLGVSETQGEGSGRDTSGIGMNLGDFSWDFFGGNNGFGTNETGDTRLDGLDGTEGLELWH